MSTIMSWVSNVGPMAIRAHESVLGFLLGAAGLFQKVLSPKSLPVFRFMGRSVELTVLDSGMLSRLSCRAGRVALRVPSSL